MLPAPPLPEIELPSRRRPRVQRALCLVLIPAFALPILLAFGGAAPSVRHQDALRSEAGAEALSAPTAPGAVAVLVAPPTTVAPTTTAAPVTTTTAAPADESRRAAPKSTSTTAPTTTTAPKVTVADTPSVDAAPATTAPPASSAPSPTPTTTPATPTPTTKPAAPTPTTRPATTTTTTRPAPTRADSGQATWYRWKAGNCASNDLPKGTVVTVTAVASGRQATCVVGDTGAFRRPTIIDLDATVFEKIAPLGAGRISVIITW
jgi:outer membrane biosynthesis protein TonB